MNPALATAPELAPGRETPVHTASNEGEDAPDSA
jgi:hypothetical protein